jgi:hypothetical protein
MTLDAALSRGEPEPEPDRDEPLQPKQSIDIVLAWLIDLEIKHRLNGQGDLYRDLLFSFAFLKDEIRQ